MTKDTPPYVKLYADDFIAGVDELDCELRGAFITICLRIWSKGGALEDDDHLMARWCYCSVRKWKILKGRLIEAGKIEIKSGFIRQKRAENELKIARTERKKKIIGGRKGGKKRAKNTSKVQNSANPPQGKLEGMNEGEHDTQQQGMPQATRTRTRTNIKNTKKEIDQFFDEHFWPLCPRKVSKERARKVIHRILKNEEATQDQLLQGMRQHAKEMASRDPDYIPHPSTWLNDGRWSDQAAISGGEVIDFASPEEWRKRVSIFHERGSWSSKWGPRPNEPGCLAPKPEQEALL